MNNEKNPSLDMEIALEKFMHDMNVTYIDHMSDPVVVLLMKIAFREGAVHGISTARDMYSELLHINHIKP